MPMTVRPGWSLSSARVWPARPMVASTSTAPAPLSAGAKSPRTRSSMTGTCDAAPSIAGSSPSSRMIRCPCLIAVPGQVAIRATATGRCRLTPGKWRQPEATVGRGWRPRRALGFAMLALGLTQEPGVGIARSQDPWQHLLRCVRECVFLLLQVGVPGGRVPDLQPGVRTDHYAVALQRGVFAQRGRDGDPALLVGHLVRCAREEHAAVVADCLRGHRRGAQRLGDPAE